ncbi:MAG: hypothetical protein PUE91_05485 [Clostridiales bacterium]|nr:hypothetical protein [Clostridiales bacterium]
MIDLLRQIILCITAASLFCAVALSLVPDGALKEVIRMGTGLVLILSLVIPLRQSLPHTLTDLLPEVSVPEQQIENVYQQAVIRQVEVETARYVVQQAEALDISCTASVTAAADGNGIVSITAVQIVLDETISDSSLASLRTQLRQELGITDACIRIQ